MFKNVVSVICCFVSLLSCGQDVKNDSTKNAKPIQTIIKANKMKVEIWSDVMCPFCYIGKRKFEKALNQFTENKDIEIIWKSYQLDPNSVTDPSLNSIKHLAQKKGWSESQAKETSEYVTNIAKQVGLSFNFDKAVVANSFDAHRLSHLALEKGVQDKLEEALFKAYFTDGKNTADAKTLLELGLSVGLTEADINKVLSSNQYAEDVKFDINEANQLGVRGVPFFVFDRKYAVSGAQESDTFFKTLEKAYAEWRKANPKTTLDVTEGAVCTPDGECK